MVKDDKRKACFNAFNNGIVIGLRLDLAHAPFLRFIPFIKNLKKGISGVGR